MMATNSRHKLYRDKIKEDPEKYENYKKAGKLRIIRSRLNKLKETLKNGGKQSATEKQKKNWREQGKRQRD